VQCGKVVCGLKESSLVEIFLGTEMFYKAHTKLEKVNFAGASPMHGFDAEFGTQKYLMFLPGQVQHK
jgi:hypothetical protein